MAIRPTPNSTAWIIRYSIAEICSRTGIGATFRSSGMPKATAPDRLRFRILPRAAGSAADQD
ncbi:hypothetical protein GCM10007301_25550 [Azorhizobium oxalatiphilum]|uniref:Uncharacterized protein n=1 Tax=Azorhizobium oxalatiphilum TaxID=980631 RepID=A0A917BZ93_9HYPH|nr:hypothetical protein GCM10007301_25550 [Azorhizobium oxalatiphilum]